MERLEPLSYPPPKAPSDRVNVQKTWRAAGWKPTTKQSRQTAIPVHTRREKTP